MSHYDAAIHSLLMNDPELAIIQIRQAMYEIKKAEILREIEEFELQSEVSHLHRSTDFLPFQGWEAA